MKLYSHIRSVLTAVGALAASAAFAQLDPFAPPTATPQATATLANSNFTAKVTARIKQGGGAWQDVELFGRQAGKIFYTSRGAAHAAAVETFDETNFELSYNENKVYEAALKRDWMGAAGLLLPALKNTFPYLDMPNNNAVDLVVDAGDYVMRSAAADLRLAKTTEDEEKVRKKYEAAYAILTQAWKAEWSPKGTIARIKSVTCLMEMGKPRTALYYFEKVDAPMPGDLPFGIYWLVKAEMEFQKKDYRASLDSAVKSLCFEDKDIDTFPDALLLSARCYEELLEYYRARDVYYEVAKLFQQTDWETTARDRLQSIMDKGLTKNKEVIPVENVFFNLTEDLNAKALALLNGTEPKVDAVSVGKEEAPPEDEKPEPEKPWDGVSEPPSGPPQEAPAAPPPMPTGTPQR